MNATERLALAHISEKVKLYTLRGTRGAIKTYRNEPWSLNAAVRAAGHYAKRDKRSMLVIEGNSYMRKVYQVIPATDDPTRITAMPGVFNAVLVESSGDAFSCEVIA